LNYPNRRNAGSLDAFNGVYPTPSDSFEKNIPLWRTSYAAKHRTVATAKISIGN
jgi:hypothetical protein